MSAGLPVPPGQHARAAARFLADGARARRHDAAGWHLRSGRDRGAGTVPEWEALREAATSSLGAEEIRRLVEEELVRVNGRGGV